MYNHKKKLTESIKAANEFIDAATEALGEIIDYQSAPYYKGQDPNAEPMTSRKYARAKRMSMELHIKLVNLRKVGF